MQNVAVTKFIFVLMASVEIWLSNTDFNYSPALNRMWGCTGFCLSVILQFRLSVMFLCELLKLQS